MEGMEKKLAGKKLAAIAIAAIVIVAAVVGAYWWFFLRPASPGFSVSSNEVEPGELVTVSGSVNASDVTVTLNYTYYNGSTVIRTVKSDLYDKFTDTFNSTWTGKWTVTASIEGETIYYPLMFYIFVSPSIKIGVIRNLLMYGQCMEEASIMAVDEINDAGGILGRKVVLAFGDEGTEAATGVAEITRLITVEGVDFITGGYRSDIVFPMREVAMDHQKIFIMDAATTELLNCEDSLTMPDCGHCLRCDYNRYKYLFRILPPNSSLVFTGTLIPFLNGYVVPMLGGSEESPVKVAAVIENLAWTDVLAKVYEGLFPIVFGTNMVKVRDKPWRPGHLDTNFETILTEIRDSGAKLIIHVLSDEAGISFIKQWGEM